MSAWISRLDRLFLRLRARPFFYRFTLFTRILLAAAFVPTGWVKLLGRRFANISTESPIGAFFEAMYQTGGYWQFIGAGQVTAGLLLLIPATAHLGALFFLPIMANIFVITVALDFKGTTLITGPMVLAVLYLCAWDYHRWRGLLTLAPPTVSPEPTLKPTLMPTVQRLDRVEQTGFAVFGACLMAACLATRGGFPMAGVPYAAVLGLLAGLVTLGRFFTHGRHGPTSA